MTTLSKASTFTSNNFYKGVSLFFSKNLGTQQTFEKLDIFNRDQLIKDFSYKSDFVLKRRGILNKILRLNFFKKMIFLKRNFGKKTFLTDFTFKHKFLKKKFRVFRFLKGNYC